MVLVVVMVVVMVVVDVVVVGSGGTAGDVMLYNTRDSAGQY